MRRFPNERQFAELTISIGAVLASVAFSLIHLLFDPLPNPDGVVYLLAAQAWLDDGYAWAAAIYPLPLYSILIAWTHEVSGLALLTSAHCLDVALIAGLIVALQRLSAALGGSNRVQIIVVVLALLLPELNGYRSFLLRDFGYWMFAVVALTLLVRHAVAPTLMRATGFVVMCGLAAAFRAEAVALLVATPVALLAGQNGRAFAMLAVSVSIAVASAALAAAVLSEPATTTWLAETLHQGVTLAAEIPAGIAAQIGGFATHVLDPGFHDYAALGLAGGLATMIVVHIVNAASLPLAGVALVGLAKGTSGRVDRRAMRVIYAAFGITVIALAVVLMARGIIQTRYAMPAGLLILVVAAFVIDEWYARANVPPTRMRLASALLVAYFIGEAGFGLLNSKHHYVEAAQWLARNTPSDARIFSNDLRVVYLAGRQVEWRNASAVGASGVNAPVGTYDFWVTNAARGQSDADEGASARGLMRVAQFANRKGQTVSIYAAPSPTTGPGLAR